VKPITRADRRRLRADLTIGQLYRRRSDGLESYVRQIYRASERVLLGRTTAPRHRLDLTFDEIIRDWERLA
jgi:hypothetical protein